MAELEAHGPAAQISLIELFFRGILEIGAANDETVGRELRELSAEQIFVVEAESPPLRAQPQLNAASPLAWASAWPQLLPISA
jgi:hypothetical protein